MLCSALSWLRTLCPLHILLPLHARSLLAVLTLACVQGARAAIRPNDVKATCPPDADLCEFDFTITHNITMTLWPSRERMLPVVFRKHKLIVRNKNCSERYATQDEHDRIELGDGTPKKVMLVNGQFPGPPIIVHHGQQISVRVFNALENEVTTLHWHGLHQRLTPWMDGAGIVSQCPILPGESFTYRFLAHPVGTHWYHSHYGTQRSMGIYGALIVLPKSEDQEKEFRGKDKLPKFDKDLFMVVSDSMNQSSYEVYHRLKHEVLTMPDLSQTPGCYYPTRQSDGVELGITPFFSGLINGKGHHFDSWSGQRTDPPLEVFTIKRGTKNRFRVISAAMLYPFRISIDRHDLHVIATDGNDVVTTTVESLIVQSGERYDFWVEARDPTLTGKYWIRMQTAERFNLTQPIQGSETYAILRYACQTDCTDDYPTSKRKRCTKAHPCKVLNCPARYYPLGSDTYCIPVSELRHPLMTPTSVPDDKEDDFKEVFLNFYFGALVELGAFHPLINGIVHTPSVYPPQRYPTKRVPTCEKCDTTVCKCNHQIEAPLGKLIQMVLFVKTPELDPHGMTGTSHPVHLHGHSFEVIKYGWPIYNRTTGLFLDNTPDILCPVKGPCNNPRWRNSSWSGGNVPGIVTHGPVLKDTVNVPAGGYVVIRFRADNPGFWFLHCHVEFHNEMGMALVMKEGEATDMTANPIGMPQCGGFDWSRDEFKHKLKHPTETELFVLEALVGSGTNLQIKNLSLITSGLALSTIILALVAGGMYTRLRPRPQEAVVEDSSQFLVDYSHLPGTHSAATGSDSGSGGSGSSGSSGSVTTVRSLSNSLAT